MINKFIIVLTDKRQAELIKRMVDTDDDLAFMQSHIDNWLDDAKRWEHAEK